MCRSLFLNGAGVYCLNKSNHQKKIRKPIQAAQWTVFGTYRYPYQADGSSMLTKGIEASVNEILRDQQVLSVAKWRG